MKKTIDLPASWFQWLSDHCVASSGYGGNLTGMRKLYWGKDALVVRCCKYLFKMNYQDFMYCCGRR